jgi:hypothetical protein
MGRPAKPLLDLTGQQFERLTVLEYQPGSRPNRSGPYTRAAWLCRCECGSTARARGDDLRSGSAKSCGCLQAENLTAWRVASRVDLSGQTFGWWTVLRFDRSEPRPQDASPGSKVFWWCRCRCGREQSVDRSNLTTRDDPKCLECGFGERLKQDWAFRFLYRTYRSNAVTRGLGFHLTRAEFDPLVISPCHYCGVAPSRALKHKKRTSATFLYNGVDRVDPGDYVMGNVVPCCWDCNRFKGARTGQEFLARCLAVAARHS